jgi:Copper transport outer membrane protein, MctB
MGYSARYHAFSIIAVFVALAVGIVIGAGLGDNIVGGATKGLEESLKQDVRNSQTRQDELNTQLQREQDFGNQVYPDLVGGRLRGESVGLVAIGGLPDEVTKDVEAAIEPTGAKLSEVAVVHVPPDRGQIVSSLQGTGLANLAQDPARTTQLGRRLGTQLAGGGPLLRRSRAALFDRFSGETGTVDRLIVVRTIPTDLPATDEQAATDFESGVLDGIGASGVPAVGVERTDAEESSISSFDDVSIPSVDDVDLVAGKVAMVYALLGAQGNYGVKDTADSLLPQLVVTPPSAATGARP